jgi:hypothetical protein
MEGSVMVIYIILSVVFEGFLIRGACRNGTVSESSVNQI